MACESSLAYHRALAGSCSQRRAVIRGLLGADLAELDLLESPLFAVPISLLAAVMEEFGWRGFLLPRLLESRSAVKAALIVGGAGALWHAPINSLGVSKYGAHTLPILLVPLVLPIAEAVIMVWIHNSTRRSMLIMVLAHFSITGGHMLLSLPSPTAAAELKEDLIIAGVLALAAIAVVAASGPMQANRSKRKAPVWPGRRIPSARGRPEPANRTANGGIVILATARLHDAPICAQHADFDGPDGLTSAAKKSAITPASLSCTSSFLYLESGR